ncbi:hypothetical protein HXX76_013449 [Chlamydomonas incerta]|uniref:Phosphodiesterase n=1 Tax=Chlamydomonas incerta TaxID=51695 RepID=A0A835SPC9_CHLIN|nr:hypothetical protein HXX76_013449 [Chlamydomonas incerta]|eukprot:KAG2425824.1 hypothetical protein HXX76_013449 [Chlamydomonas incerta]
MVKYNPNWDAVQTMFLALAPTMLNTSSSLDTHLIRLEPAGVVRLEYPADGPDQALGVDVLSPLQPESAAALAAARRHQLTLDGPVHVFDGGYGMIARKPIYIYNVTGNERFGQLDVPNPACGEPCGYNATKRTAFWGYAVILFSVNELSTSPDSPLRILDSLKYRYELRAVNASERPLANSAEPPVNPEEVTVSLYENEWVLRVSTSEALSASRYVGLLAGIVVLAVALAAMCFALLVSRKRNKELLEALLPREVIKSLREEQAAKSLKDAMGPANILSADTPADLLMLLLGQLLEGNLPDVRDVVFIRTALARGCDLYEPLNLTSHINNANLDSDVAQALMQQLGGGGGAGGIAQPRYSTNSRVRRRLHSLVTGRSNAGSMADYDPDTDTDSIAGGMLTSVVMANGSAVSGKIRRSEDAGPGGAAPAGADTLASALALLMTPRPAAWMDRGLGSASEVAMGPPHGPVAIATPSLLPAGLGGGRVPVSVAAVAAATAAAGNSGAHGRQRQNSLSGTHQSQSQQQERGSQSLWERAAAALMLSHGGGGSGSGAEREHGRSERAAVRAASAARRASALDPGAVNAPGFLGRLGSSSRRYSVETSSHFSALGSAAVTAAAAAAAAAAAGDCEDGNSDPQRFSGAGAGAGGSGGAAGAASPFLTTGQPANQLRSTPRLHDAFLVGNGPPGGAGAGAGPSRSRPASGPVVIVPVSGRSGRAVSVLPASGGAAAPAAAAGATLGAGGYGSALLTGSQVRVATAAGAGAGAASSGPGGVASSLGAAGGNAGAVGAAGSAGGRGGGPESASTGKLPCVTRMQPAAVTFAEMRAGVVSGAVDDGGLISGTLPREEGTITQTSEMEMAMDAGLDMGSLLELGGDGTLDLGEMAAVVRGAPAGQPELRASSRMARLQLSQQQMLQQLPQQLPPPLPPLPLRPQSLQLRAQSGASGAAQSQEDFAELPMPPLARPPPVQPLPPPQTQTQRRVSGVLGLLTRRVTGSVGSPGQSPSLIPAPVGGPTAAEVAASTGGSTGPSAGGAGGGGALGAAAVVANQHSFSGSLKGLGLGRSASGRAPASSGAVLLSVDGMAPLAHQPQSRLGAQEKEKEKEKSGFLSKLGSSRHMTWGSNAAGGGVVGGMGAAGSAGNVANGSSEAFGVASAAALAQAQAQALAYAKQSLPPPPTVIQEVERLLAKSDSWEFDTWALQEATQGHALSVLGFYLMQRAGLVTRFKLNPTQLARLLRAIENGYLDNPYHSAIHAADVLQTMHVVIHAAQLHVHYLDALGLLASYYAAIVHDFAHPGLTGDFLIATSDPLAIRYNDRSPLENHHCAASFGLLRRRELDALAPLSQSERSAFRRQVIELVLSTDMKQHFSILSHFNTVHRLAAYSGQAQQAATGSSGVGAAAKTTSGKKPPRRTVSRALSTLPSNDPTAAAFMDTWTEYPPPRPVDDTERLLSLQIALKCADIGHLGESFEVHKKWLTSLEEEFFRQGDRERQLGLPISPLFDRAKQGVSKSQVGFYDFVALPLVHALSSAFPGSKPLMRCLLRNYNHWRVSEGQPPVEIPCGGVRGGSQDQKRGDSRNGTGTGMQGLLLSVPDDLVSSAVDIVPPLADDNKKISIGDSP